MAGEGEKDSGVVALDNSRVTCQGGRVHARLRLVVTLETGTGREVKISQGYDPWTRRMLFGGSKRVMAGTSSGRSRTGSRIGSGKGRDDGSHTCQGPQKPRTRQEGRINWDAG